MKKTISLLTIVFSFYAFGQENCDTLFIKYDDRLLEKRQHPVDEYFYYVIEGGGTNGIIYFEEETTVKNTFKKIKPIRLKKILRKSKAYYKKNKFDDWKLSQYFHKKKYTSIYLVKDSILYKIKVVYAIE